MEGAISDFWTHSTRLRGLRALLITYGQLELLAMRGSRYLDPTPPLLSKLRIQRKLTELEQEASWGVSLGFNRVSNKYP